jgi:hypothetical protein
VGSLAIHSQRYQNVNRDTVKASTRPSSATALCCRALRKINDSRDRRLIEIEVRLHGRSPPLARWSEFSLGLSGRSRLSARRLLTPDGAHFLELGAG